MERTIESILCTREGVIEDKILGVTVVPVPNMMTYMWCEFATIKFVWEI